jgi:NADH-quinone oxidoreductase subunit F
MGTPLRQVIDEIGGGPRRGRQIKAVSSGVANAVVTADHLDVPVSYEGFAAIGSGMGSAGFIVFDDEACMIEVARRYSQFLHVESCGQCPACKNGSAEITGLLQRIEAGEGEADDLDELAAWLEKVTDGNRCFLAVEERTFVLSVLQAFPDEVVEHLELGRCPRPKPIVLPKLVDIIEGVAVYDERIDRKLPDWTYAPAP